MRASRGHSFDLRLPRGKIGQDIVSEIAVGGSHTGEEVMVTADGPGAERIRGFLHNTDIFQAMKSAFGWRAHPGFLFVGNLDALPCGTAQAMSMKRGLFLLAKTSKPEMQYKQERV